ncbi:MULTISPECIES: GNAT family N-acetyltransferase [Persicobacter]|uniref:N-acetyltransferase domain-containing protein n=1 Tax=Persicobacter diffluens TaxID=981 RepID=A0AAN5AL69_9BACT|nr:GNAT family N-acetyltransferase [Persicobacter sp. CCB-QB2]GJM61151.1 hypothetical protein PEDI_17030 [Persicobacter diffluens]
MIKVKKVSSPEGIIEALNIRERVFVDERQGKFEEEIDEFEQVSEHFLAKDENGRSCGSARWRFAEMGIVLEKFAVLSEYRGKGVGKALSLEVLLDISKNPNTEGFPIYLYASPESVALYQTLGFNKKEEYKIISKKEHVLMIKE